MRALIAIAITGLAAFMFMLGWSRASNHCDCFASIEPEHSVSVSVVEGKSATEPLWFSGNGAEGEVFVSGIVAGVDLETEPTIAAWSGTLNELSGTNAGDANNKYCEYARNAARTMAPMEILADFRSADWIDGYAYGEDSMRARMLMLLSNCESQ